MCIKKAYIKKRMADERADSGVKLTAPSIFLYNIYVFKRPPKCTHTDEYTYE
jgi:hypothetical protein